MALLSDFFVSGGGGLFSNNPTKPPTEEYTQSAAVANGFTVVGTGETYETPEDAFDAGIFKIFLKNGTYNMRKPYSLGNESGVTVYSSTYDSGTLTATFSTSDSVTHPVDQHANWTVGHTLLCGYSSSGLFLADIASIDSTTISLNNVRSWDGTDVTTKTWAYASNGAIWVTDPRFAVPYSSGYSLDILGESQNGVTLNLNGNAFYSSMFLDAYNTGYNGTPGLWADNSATITTSIGGCSIEEGEHIIRTTTDISTLGTNGRPLQVNDQIRSNLTSGNYATVVEIIDNNTFRINLAPKQDYSNLSLNAGHGGVIDDNGCRIRNLTLTMTRDYDNDFFEAGTRAYNNTLFDFGDMWETRSDVDGVFFADLTIGEMYCQNNGSLYGGNPYGPFYDGGYSTFIFERCTFTGTNSDGEFYTYGMAAYVDCVFEASAYINNDYNLLTPASNTVYDGDGTYMIRCTFKENSTFGYNSFGGEFSYNCTFEPGTITPGAWTPATFENATIGKSVRFPSALTGQSDFYHAGFDISRWK